MQGLTIILIALASLVVVSNSAQLAPIRAAANSASSQPGAPPTSNFALEVVSIIRSIPRKQIQHLVQAYLLNDAEFQALIRDINSLSAYRIKQQLLRQPELRQLFNWLNQQLILAGSSIKIFDDLELEIKIFNKYPNWSQSVNGISGFETEFYLNYPVEVIRSQLEQSAQRNPIFNELWRRLIALKVVYERVLATPQAKVFVSQLQARGLDTAYLDSLIRYQFGWSNGTLPNYDYIGQYDYAQYI